MYKISPFLLKNWYTPGAVGTSTIFSFSKCSISLFQSFDQKFYFYNYILVYSNSGLSIKMLVPDP